MFVSVVLLLFKALSIPKTSSINSNSNNNNGTTVSAVYVSEKCGVDGPFVLETRMYRYRICLYLSVCLIRDSEWITEKEMLLTGRFVWLPGTNKHQFKLIQIMSCPAITKHFTLISPIFEWSTFCNQFRTFIPSFNSSHKCRILCFFLTKSIRMHLN